MNSTEAQAAKEAGITARIVVRPGNAPLTDEEKVNFTSIESFLDLSFQTSAKRQKVEKPEEKVNAEPETSVAEPMDTSDGAPEPKAESVVDKSIEKKPEASKPTTEAAKVEESQKMAEKAQGSSMEIDVKVETEKKSGDVVDKPVDSKAEELGKKEEESKTSENKEAPKESAAVCEIAKKDSEVGKKDNEVVKAESEAPKKEVEVAKSDNEVVKKETTEEAKKDEEVGKKEAEATKSEKVTDGGSAATKLDTEPMDEDKCVLPSKSENIATTKEDKTEVCAKPADPVVKPEKKAETEVSSKPVETTVTDSKIDNETEEKKSTATRESSGEAVAAVAAAAESKTETTTTTTTVEDKSTPVVTTTEKTEPEVVAKTIEKAATIESSDKAQAIAEEAKTDVKLNGDSATAKSEQVQSSEKKESNGDAKEENTKMEPVAASVTETTKVSSAVEKSDEKMEPIVENAKKNETEVETKANADASSTVESTDAKLNGTAGGDSGKDETEKPHRNGLNGDSSTEKSNGNTQNEAASSSQNGEAESSIGAAASSAESIKTKKVVDSTIADGAGEPDVVLPPVPVAATS